jgi:hypothetical protein
MKKSDLTAMTVAELKALARKKRITLPSGAKKAGIIAALLAADAKKPAKAAAKKAMTPAKGKEAKRPRRTPGAGPGKPGERWEMPAGVEEPLMAQEQVEDAKYYTGPAQPAPAAGAYAELPQGYGEDRITIMARDPSVAFAYWEVTPGRLEREKAWFGWDSKLCIRIYDVTGVQFDGTNAAGYYDQEIAERVGSWYFDMGRPNHSFCADIGLRTPDGRFLTLARSNYVTMPRDGVSDVIDEEWMVAEEEFWKLYGFPGGLSSAEVSEFWRQRRMHGISSPGMSGRERGKGKHRA